MTAEFICTDCAAMVFAFGADAPPASGRCSVCEWLAEFVPDLATREALRTRSCSGPDPPDDTYPQALSTKTPARGLLPGGRG